MASFDEAIPPGQAGTIRAVVHTANLSGAIGKMIQVYTNDPKQANIALNITGNVAASVQLLPSNRMAVFGRGQQRPYTAKLLVRRDPSETAELVVSELKPSVPWITATARRLKAPEDNPGLPQGQANDWVVEVQVSPPPSTETSSQHLTFKTGLKLEPEIVVPIAIQIPQFVSVQPVEVLLRPVEGAPSEGTVLMVLRTGLDPSAAKFETSQPNVFKVETAQAGPTPRHLRVTVKASPSDVTPGSTGTLTLRLGEDTKSIPIRIAAPTK